MRARPNLPKYVITPMPQNAQLKSEQSELRLARNV